MVLHAHGITGTQVLETDRCTNVTSLHEIDGILVVGVHLVQAGYPFLLQRAYVVHIRTRVKMSRIYPHKGQTAHEGIGSDLEHEGAERILGLGMAFDLLPCPRVGTLDGLDVERGRKIAHHAVEEELHALVLEGRTAACGDDLHGDGALADGGDDLVLGDGIGIVEELLHQGLVALGGGLN